MQVLIVADDLTGALDSAVAFAKRGLRCRVARRPSEVGAALSAQPDVLAVSTASREADAAWARSAVAEVLASTAGFRPRMFFKKVDSRLKGHVAAELHAMAEGAGAASALVAPAVPAQGRIVKDLHVVGTGVAAPIDIAATCSGSGLQLTIPDTASDLDLDAALAVLAGEPRPLLVGAAGLAAALARQLVPECPALPATNLPAPLLLAVGSRDPITLGQLAVLKAAKGAMDLTDAGSPGPDAIGPAWLLQLRTAPDGLDGHEVGAAFAAAVEELLLARGVKTLFACGGETADAILGRLGAGVLTVEGEFLPGVPVASTIVNGRPLRVVTKSGGFGDPDTLLSVARAVEQDDGTARDE